MEIVNSLSFREAVFVAVAAAIIFTALFAWIYMLLTGKKSKGENRDKITRRKPLKSQATAISPDTSNIRIVDSDFLNEIESDISDFSLKIDYLENLLKVCSMVIESISFEDVGSVTKYKEPLSGNYSIKSKIEKLKQKGLKESDIATKLNLSSELKKLYFHAGKQRDKVRVG